MVPATAAAPRVTSPPETVISPATATLVVPVAIVNTAASASFLIVTSDVVP